MLVGKQLCGGATLLHVHDLAQSFRGAMRNSRGGYVFLMRELVHSFCSRALNVA
jgi:hypothetical protein